MYVDARVQRFIEKYKRQLWLALIVVGFLLRFIGYTSLPAGLNQDEASIGYEAWALLNHGVDRSGNSLPALLVAWGSGQNVLYAYLSMPFIALFGLRVASVRLLAVVLGVLALAVMYALAARLHGPLAGLIAMAVLCFNPWHIMASRWALESNILPFFLLLGLYLLVVALEKPWFLPLAAGVFALSLYAYGSAFIVLPFFFLLCLVYFWGKRALRLWPTVVAGVVFVVLALPVVLANLINMLGWQQMSLLGITLPELTEGRQQQTMNFEIWENLKKLLKVLVFGEDHYAHNSLPRGGLFSPGGLVLAGVGAWRTVRTLRRSPDEDKGGTLVLAMLGTGLLCGQVVDGNVNRLNFLYMPVVYMQALGIAWLCAVVPRLYYEKKKQVSQAFCVLLAGVYMAGSLLYFGSEYLSASYRAQLEYDNYAGLGPAIQYAETVRQEQGGGSIFVTNKLAMPYIYALFYSQTPPQEFVDTVNYVNPDGAFRLVKSFGHYEFDPEPGVGQPGKLYIFYHDQHTENIEHLAGFGDFVVGIGVEADPE